MDKKEEVGWIHPKAEYRPIPFWSWNETLNPEILREQIKEMAEQGMGGYFMHARAGLTIPYLSETWYECIRTGIEEAQTWNLDAWIYDEEGWPSGFAGGIVPQMCEAYQAKCLKLVEFHRIEEIDLANSLALFVYKEEQTGNQMRFLSKEEAMHVSLCEQETFISIERMLQKTYIDVMNRNAVNAFIQVTHEEYWKRFQPAFGSRMKGFFTDEPRFTCTRFGIMPWSDGLEEEYQKRYQTSLIQELLSLWKPVGRYEQVRYQYWTMVNELFVQNYMKTLYDWCESHGCLLTGHVMMEESIFSQMTGTAGVMPFYEYEHVPGIDWLRRRIESPVIAKQVGSVACQLERKRVITESFALSGWNLSLEEMKWILEWQYVNGVNLLCQHLEAYSLKGNRKRDYPPSIFYQQSWWKTYKTFTDYIARLGSILAEGEEVADVLVIHPMRSGYICYDGNRPEQIRKLDAAFQELSIYLSGQHIGYHYGDETILGKYGSIEGKQLKVGAIRYSVVVLPHMYAIDKETIDLLLSFVQNGGVLFHTGDFPHYTNGDTKKLALLYKYSHYIEMTKLREVLYAKGFIRTSICDKKEEVTSIGQQLRKIEDGILLYLVNHNKEERISADVTIFGKYDVTMLSLEDGIPSPVPFSCETDTIIPCLFEPMQSYVFLLKETKAPAFLPATKRTQYVSPGDIWTVETMGRNSLTLDICRYEINQGELTGTLPILKLMELLLQRQKDSDVTLFYEFEVDMDLTQNKELLLAIEDMELYQITINQIPVANQATGWWKDRAFQTIDIKPYVISGHNTITLKMKFHQEPHVYEVLYGEGVYETEKNKLTYTCELEAIYIIGDFGVMSRSGYKEAPRHTIAAAGPFILTDVPRIFYGNEFVTQGLLFMAEEFSISQQFEIHKEPNTQIRWNYGKPNIPVMEIFINGKPIKTAAWAPYEVDITDWCVEGWNQLTLRLFPSNRNLLGPHHHKKGECYGVGPSSFTGAWSWVERETEADGTDFEDRTQKYWIDDYTFVKVGLYEHRGEV